MVIGGEGGGAGVGERGGGRGGGWWNGRTIPTGMGGGTEGGGDKFAVVQAKGVMILCRML